jgi:alanine racemase
VQVRRIGAGEAVGYGGAFVAEKSTYIATLPVGYADGIPRMASCFGRCAVLGEKRFLLVGRVSMDQCTVLLGEEPVEEGEFLTLLGGAGAASVEKTAKSEGRIPYELLTSLGTRIPRVYLNL